MERTLHPSSRKITGRRTPRRRAGFSLLEALMAAGILVIIVVAVGSAVTAGQQQAYEARLYMAAAIAAEELMGFAASRQYEDLRDNHASETQPIGSMVDMDGQAMPEMFDRIGRSLQASETLRLVWGTGVVVRGLDVTVRAFDASGTLVELTHFIPEPAGGAEFEEDEDDDDIDFGFG